MVQLSPFFLGPTEFLDGGGQVEEVDRDDRSSGPEICVSDEGIELPPGLYQAGMDRSKSLGLLWGVPVPVAQGALLVSEGRGSELA